MRSISMYFLPYMLFSFHTPYASETVCSTSASRVNGRSINWSENASPHSYRLAKKLSVDRSTHRYRFVIEDPGECLGIAFSPGIYRHEEQVWEGFLKARVQSTPIVEMTQSEDGVWAATKPNGIELSAEERTEALLAIAEGYRVMCSKIEKREELPDHMRTMLLEEAMAWADGKLEGLSVKSRKGTIRGKKL